MSSFFEKIASAVGFADATGDEAYATEATTAIDDADLYKIERQYTEEAAANTLTPDATFTYGWALIRSAYKRDRTKGIEVLRELMNSSTAAGRRRRDCLYYLAMGSFRNKKYDEAARFIGLLLAEEPENAQAKALRSLIENQMRKEGFVGATLVGGIAFASVAALASIFMRSSSKK